jgi:hypothetical protein
MRLSTCAGALPLIIYLRSLFFECELSKVEGNQDYPILYSLNFGMKHEVEYWWWSCHGVLALPVRPASDSPMYELTIIIMRVMFRISEYRETQNKIGLV